MASEVARDWGLSLGEPFALSRFSYVAPAGDEAVLKIVPPEDDESAHEADALALWDGDGAVRLLRHDRARRAMLLERARPGDDASGLSDDGALAVAREVGGRVWRLPPRGTPFERVADRVPAWLDAAGDDPLVRAARDVYATLDVGADVVVHGDFHHHNLLRHGERWVAIDPKPMIGEREFDVVTLFWNPLGARPTRAHVERTIAAFAADGLDPVRMRAWGIVRGAYLGLPSDGRGDAPQVAVARMLLAS